ncbi:hypothetical protein GCM10027094_01370 [Hafnia psychrotolerans]
MTVESMATEKYDKQDDVRANDAFIQSHCTRSGAILLAAMPEGVPFSTHLPYQREITGY